MAIFTIEQIENAFIAKLTTEIGSGSSLDPNWGVEPYPDDPDNYEFTHYNGGVLIKYGGSQFGQAQMLMQKRKARWDFVVWARWLRSPTGIYALLELVRKYMSSMQPRTSQTDESLILHEDGIWQYGMRFEVDYIYQLGM